jgi:beta-aspartyl-peptidase (threonine type)
MKENIRLLIHGGAGSIHLAGENKMNSLQNLQGLCDIVKRHYLFLLGGEDAIDIAEQAVIDLENYEGFNAGRGAVLNGDGIAELDASIMDGRHRRAGAIAGVQRVKNPISGARGEMEHSRHVMLAGANADLFCQQHGVETVTPDYFITSARQDQLRQAKQKGHAPDLKSFGTVGAVVCDIRGNLAAATSTGGKTNKVPGRIGDSSIIGAGTWADNNTCAVSATGDGEVLMRSVFAHGIAMMIQLNIADLSTACLQMLNLVAKLGGEGGCIAIDKQGHTVMRFNSSGMYRGWIDKEGKAHSAVL